MNEQEIEIDKILDKKKEGNLYLKRLQIKLKNNIESGVLNPDQQYAEVGNTIDKLLACNLITEEAAEKFYDKENKYIKESQELEQRISSFYKTTYESLLEL